MEKRVLLAALLSAIFLSWYSNAVLKWKNHGIHVNQGLIANQQAIKPTAENPKNEIREKISHLIEKEEIASIESSEISLAIGSSSGSIRSITLKNFQSGKTHSELKFSPEIPVITPLFDGSGIVWNVKRRLDNEIELMSENKGIDYNISYLLDRASNLITIMLSISSKDMNLAAYPSTSFLCAWEKSDSAVSRYNNLELFLLNKNDKNKKFYKRLLSSRSNGKIVPRGTLVATLAERYFCASIKPNSGYAQSELLPSENGIMVSNLMPYPNIQDNGNIIYKIEAYIGPRDYFYLKRAAFDEAFPIGILGQIGLVLLFILSWIAGITKNYGIAIILLSTGITCLMAPFTLLGFRSMRKMQLLKPKIDKIMEQHKNDSQRANKEVFALYKEHKISPLSGCLPMLLQIPVFIALFQAISHYVELRGKRFLWIADLSLPDRLAKIPFSLPLLGNEVNILPIIMAIAMYFQTKLSQGSMQQDTNTQVQNPFTGPLMPILFGVMFYTVPSSLVLYWITNTVISIGWYKKSMGT